MGTFLAPRQSTRDCAVALADEEDVDVFDEVVETVELAELPQVPNCGWQPVPQYALVVPHQPDLSARLFIKYENDTILRAAGAEGAPETGHTTAAGGVGRDLQARC
jgi:hypothetical protein